MAAADVAAAAHTGTNDFELSSGNFSMCCQCFSCCSSGSMCSRCSKPVADCYSVGNVLCLVMMTVTNVQHRTMCLEFFGLGSPASNEYLKDSQPQLMTVPGFAFERLWALETVSVADFRMGNALIVMSTVTLDEVTMAMPTTSMAFD